MHGGVAEVIQGGRPMINDKAILVGVDGSHASYKATWWAANYAKHAGLTLQIVCAYSLPSYAAVSFDATYTAMGDDNAAHSDAQEILSKAKAIADELFISFNTVRSHIRRIYVKLDVHSRQELLDKVKHQAQ